MSGSGRRDELRDEIRAQIVEARAQFEATNARIEARAGRNLFLAIGTGLALGAIFLVALFVWKEIFPVLVGVVAVVALLELATAFRVAGRRVPRVGAVLGGVTITVGVTFWGALGLLLALLAASALLVVWRLIEGFFTRWGVSPRTLWADVVAGVFTLVYIPFLGAIAILLLQLENGQWWVFTLVLLVVSCDVGAYATGVTLGKHKMTPRISPNKTWEGFAGAGVLSIISGILISVLALEQPWWIGVLLGVTVLLTATGGDLTESLIKRNLGVKDMSSWIPGHGGLLDRLDSILPSTVGVYAVALSLGVLG